MSTPYHKYKVLLQYLILSSPYFITRCESIAELDYLTHQINSMNTTWKAGISVNIMDIWESVNLTQGMVELNDSLGVEFKEYGQPRRLPDTFDARKAWPMCKSVMTRIRQQGKCGSCWAVSGASVMSDRLCIGSGGAIQVHLSAEDLLTCCPNCLSFTGKLCRGGSGVRAFRFWKDHGLVTGGEYDSNEGCKPYSRGEDYKSGISCSEECTNPSYHVPYYKDKYFSRASYKLPYADAIRIQRDIFNFGPVMALMTLYKDFMIYKTGVYRHQKGPRQVRHYVKLLGWGVESGEKYWLGINSWGKEWGVKGYFKIVRGENHVNIERAVVSGRITNPYREGTVNNSVRNQRMFYHISVFYLFTILNCVT